MIRAVEMASGSSGRRAVRLLNGREAAWTNPAQLGRQLQCCNVLMRDLVEVPGVEGLAVGWQNDADFPLVLLVLVDMKRVLGVRGRTNPLETIKQMIEQITARVRDERNLTMICDLVATAGRDGREVLRSVKEGDPGLHLIRRLQYFRGQ